MASAGIGTTPIPIRPRQENRGGGVTEEEARAMLRAVLNLLVKWQVPTPEKLVLLGSPSERTFQRWRKGEIGPRPIDTAHRLGDLLGIHKALR